MQGETTSAAGMTVREKLERALWTPIKACRIRYLPLLMIYFAYGASGLIGVASTFWVRKDLTSLQPEHLAALGVWLALPWTAKVVFGELVDTIAIFGSRRRVYVYLGASLVAASMLLLASAAGRGITFAKPGTLYIIASLLSVFGFVIQDVVADAMSTEVVERVSADGTPRPATDIERDLGMVQVLGRLALSFGILATSGLGGVLAKYLPYSTVFLIGLSIPLVSILGAMFVKLETSESRPTDWTILGGGIAFGLVTVGIGLLDLTGGQELVFCLTLAVILWMLNRITGGLDPILRRRLAFTAFVIFAFRMAPGVGEGYTWFAIDVLKFDELFQGKLAQIGATIGLVSLWMLANDVTRQDAVRVMLWITIIGTILALPTLMLVFEGHKVTERLFGIGAQGIALFDAAAQSPLAQLSMIPLLTLVAINAPASYRATWFALMASLMNLALVAGQLLTKYLTLAWPVTRGDYTNLPTLVVVATVLGFVIPVAAIFSLGKRLK